MFHQYFFTAMSYKAEVPGTSLVSMVDVIALTMIIVKHFAFSKLN